MFTNHCTPREGFQGVVCAESEPEAQLGAKQCHEVRAGSRNSSLSATQLCSCNLCPATVRSQHNCSAPGGQVPPTACTTLHSCQGRSRQELGNGTRFAKKSIMCLPPQEGASLLQERCLTKEHLWHQVHLLKQSLHMLYSWDQAGKVFEATRQVLLTDSHPSDQITATLGDHLLHSSWGLPTYEPIKAERLHRI